MSKPGIWWLSAACLVGALAAEADVTSTQLTERNTGPVRVEPDTIVLADNDAPARVVRATLRVLLYDATVGLTADGGAPTTWRGTLLRYDLHASEPAGEHTWTVWSREPLGYFQLVTDPVTRRHSYLAWMSGMTLSFTPVTLARSELIGLEDAVRERRPAEVVQAALAGMSLPDSIYGTFTSALHTPVLVTGIHRREPGGWQVTLGGQPGSPEAVTLVSSDGSTWQRE